MKIPTPGLRPLWNKSNSVAKVSLVVQPGDTIYVSDDLAAQLEADRQPFAEGVAPEKDDAPTAEAGEDDAPTVEAETPEAEETGKRPRKSR